MKNVFKGSILLIILVTLVLFAKTNVTSVYAYDQKNELFVNEIETFNDSETESLLLSDDNFVDGVFIDGKNGNQFATHKNIEDFTAVKYIPNARYFLINPKHAKNNTNDNLLGTCTTVAMQMLLGYHNYYSDRRIIPAEADGIEFLSNEYGDVESNPLFYRSDEDVDEQGCPKIGTEDGVYIQIFANTEIPDSIGYGQTLFNVVKGTRKFIRIYTAPEVSATINITDTVFNAAEARAEIDMGRPIVLQFDAVLTGASSYHVMVAYGYAKLDGVDGFLVHYGWGDKATQVWIPEEYIGYQVKMMVNHAHTFVDTGENINGTHRCLSCSVCGYETVDTLYNISNLEISSVKYPLAGEITIPYIINLYSPETAQFVQHKIYSVGAYAFANQTQITKIILHTKLTSLKEGAFSGCVELTNINIPMELIDIRAGVFKGCSKLNIMVVSRNEAFCAINNMLYNIEMTKIIATGQIMGSITIPSTINEIESYAFSGNYNLQTLIVEGEPLVGDHAFSNCSRLYNVYFYSYTLPVVGANAFSDSSFTVYVPHCRQNAYRGIFVGPEYNIQSIPIVVTLKVDGQVYQTLNTYYGATLMGITTPTKNNHTFDYWKYVDAEGNEIEYRNGGTWNVTTNITVDAIFVENIPEAIEYSIKLFDYGGEREVYRFITVVYGQPMPIVDAPQRPGYVFNGYYDQDNGAGTQYYDANMNSMRNWDVEVNDYYELIAYWTPAQYLVTLDWGYDNIQETITVTYGQAVTVANVPTRQHFEFDGYHEYPSTEGACYVTKEIKQVNGQYVVSAGSTGIPWEKTSGGTLYARWERFAKNIVWQSINTTDNTVIENYPLYIQSGVEMDITAPTYNGKDFVGWEICGVTYSTQVITVTLELHRSLLNGEITLCTATGADGVMKILYQNSCVAAGTLITLADGSQVPVETLTGNEMLLVWNLHTGSFDTAPILFIDSDEAREYQIINLYFSDGTHVKVISEHGFWDFDLNRYVYLDANAGQYVGHWFNKQVTDEDGNLAWDSVQLINVTLTKEYTTAWSPVTYGHLCLYVNGMLSMPGATGGLVNTFEVDGTTMRIDEQSYLADIATYGLYTYEEFAQEYDVPEEIFNAVQGQYLKVAIGKGLIDEQGINALINSYSQFF